jgi:hypothetical protein
MSIPQEKGAYPSPTSKDTTFLLQLLSPFFHRLVLDFAEGLIYKSSAVI